jgi:hypothetical protein
MKRPAQDRAATLPDEVAHQISDLMRIPKAKRRRIRSYLQDCLKHALRRHDIARLRLKNRDTRKPLRHIARTTRKLEEMIDNLADAPRALFDTALMAVPHRTGLHDVVRGNAKNWWLSETEKLNLLLGELAKAANDAPSVRPDGARRNDAFHGLIHDLYNFIVVDAQGDLTLAKRASDGELTGTARPCLVCWQVTSRRRHNRSRPK